MAMLNNQRVYRKYVQRFFCAMFSVGWRLSGGKHVSIPRDAAPAVSPPDLHHSARVEGTPWRQAGGTQMNPAGMELGDLSKNWWWNSHQHCRQIAIFGGFVG